MAYPDLSCRGHRSGKHKIQKKNETKGEGGQFLGGFLCAFPYGEGDFILELYLVRFVTRGSFFCPPHPSGNSQEN